MTDTELLKDITLHTKFLYATERKLIWKEGKRKELVARFVRTFGEGTKWVESAQKTTYIKPDLPTKYEHLLDKLYEMEAEGGL